MLKRISVSDVRLGMFIERLEGKWLDHPFWRTRFVLSDEDRLQTLQNSRIEWLFIDVDKGLDVAEAITPAEPAAPVAPQHGMQRTRPLVASLTPATRAPLPPPPPAAQMRHKARVQEFGKAKTLVRRAEGQIATMVLEAKKHGIVSSKAVTEVVEDVIASVERDPFAFSGLMRCKQGNPDIYRHSLMVSALMIALARKMGMSWEEVRVAGQAGLLMDIGHAYLTPGMAVEHHVNLGHEVLLAADDIPRSVVDVCLKHHERLDGSGKPLGLVEREIDDLSRMAAICDTFAALEANGDQAMMADPALAIEHLLDAPHAFAADIVRHFVEAVGLYPIGSILELESGELAMVVFGDSEGTDLPTVRTFYDLQAGKPLRGENIDLRNCYGRDRIAGKFDLSTLDLGDLSILRERILGAALKV